MTTENNTVIATTSTPLVHNEVLTGSVLKPFLKDDKLLGAVLSFDGRSETALLHVRQMSGENPTERLAELAQGDSLLVRIMIQQEGTRRKDVWATEKGIEHQLLIDMFAADPDMFKDLEGRIHGVTDFGLFVELLDGPAKGHRALLRSSSLAAPNGRVKLGAFVQHKIGDLVACDLAEARVDQSSKLLLRLESARPRKAA